MPTRRSTHVGQLKTPSLFLLLLPLLLHHIEASAPDSPPQPQQADNGHATDNTQLPISPHLGAPAHASRREPPKINTYVPNTPVQSKRLNSPINRNGYNPTGRVESIPPGLNGIDFGNQGNRYNNNAQPNPNPPRGPTFKGPPSPQKPGPALSSPRIHKSFIGDGYIDASSPGGAPQYQPRGLSGKIDGLRNPNKLLPPSIEGTKIDRPGQRLSQSPLQPPTRPQNPYAHEQRPFRTGREYLNAQRNNNSPGGGGGRERSSDVGQSKIPFASAQRSDDPFNNAQRNPSYDNNSGAQRNSNNRIAPYNNARNNDAPFNSAQRNSPYSSVNNNRNPSVNNNRNPSANNNNAQRSLPPPSPSFNNNSPKPRDLPNDIPRGGYNERLTRPRPHSTQPTNNNNSSYNNDPRNAAFSPFGSSTSGGSDSNSGKAKQPLRPGTDPNSIPALPAPFQFPDVLKGDRDFPFPSSNSFNSRPQRSRPTRNYGPSNLFQDFSNPLESYGPASQSQSKTPTNTIPQQRTPVASAAPRYHDNRAITADPRYNPAVADPLRGRGRGDLGIGIGRGGGPVYGGGPGADVYGTGRGRGIQQQGQTPQQCFQYSYPAEAYRLSDLAKDYPREQIQKEVDANPYLSPLVGQEAKVTQNDPFTFNAPISSHFDFSGFGFKEAPTTSDKYAHLKNVKVYPGNLQEGDMSGRYPSSMQPLDSACPSQEYSLKSFLHQEGGGDCYVVNPEFQQVSYNRCTRQDCNFCGVNRGLSACVEEYRWVSVIAYCMGLPENKRIAPMRLLLPVGCSCQHFVC